MRFDRLAYAFALVISPAAHAIHGFVTPSKVSVTFNSANLVDTSNRQVLIFSGPATKEFSRSDTDLSPTALSGISVPQGRFTGVNVCYSTTRSVTLDNVSYLGQSMGGGAQNGDTLCSTGVNAGDASALTLNSGACTPTALANYTVGTGTENCSQTTFTVPLCIAPAASQASVCASGDTLLDPNVTSPDLQITLDLYNSVGVNASTKALDPQVASYPYATIGKVGAAIHLGYATAGTQADIVLIYGSDRKLAYASSASNGSLAGFCGGVGAVTATAAPTGSPLNTFGPTWVMSTDFTGGTTQFATGTCTGTNCVSGGMLSIVNPYKVVGQTTNVTCVADSAASPAYLGFTYPTGAGVAGTTAFTVKRVIDPYNVLGGLCTSVAAGYLAGSTPTGAAGGACGTYP